MTNSFVPRVGGVLSADIAVPEYEREVRFYTRILTTGEQPLWRDDLLNNRGTPIIGLGPTSPEYAHIPIQWMPHIQVADVAASAQRALESGGTELLHGKDDAGNSQWAVLLDPGGAAFGIVPVVSSDAIPAAEGDDAARLGCIARLDLTVADASATRDFYERVIGWSVQEVAMTEDETVVRYTDFRMLGDDGTPAARIRHARGDNAELPPVWLLHLPVGDLTESLRRVEHEGGVVIKRVQSPDGVYTHATVQDPVGAYMTLVH